MKKYTMKTNDETVVNNMISASFDPDYNRFATALYNLTKSGHMKGTLHISKYAYAFLSRINPAEKIVEYFGLKIKVSKKLGGFDFFVKEIKR